MVIQDGNEMITLISENKIDLNTYKYTGIEAQDNRCLRNKENADTYYKFTDVWDELTEIWVNQDTLLIGQVIHSFLDQEDNGIYSEEYLLEIGVLPQKSKKILDLNNIPPLTEEHEAVMLEYEQEIRDSQKRAKKNKKKKSNIVSLSNEIKKRCKKDNT